MEPLISGLGALVLALVLTPLWIRVAPRLGAMDYPRGRHKHRQPTPTVGGIAIFLSTWAAVIAVTGWPLPHPLVGLMIASALLVCMNIYDDTRGLPPAGRLLVLIALAGVAYAWGVRIEGLTNFFGLVGEGQWVQLGWWSAPLTIFWIVLITNAMNWLDGIDGLAAGVTGSSALTLAILAGFGPELGPYPLLAVRASALFGSCAGFLRYNFAPARVFMGDTGAMFLGFTLACLSVMGAFKFPTAGTVILPVLVLGVPLFDSTTAIIKRLLKGKNPLVGDRNHIHHRLVDRGMSVPQAALVIYAFSGMLCLAALWLWSK